ncbi:hypothetical protein E2562_028777 [Oryza meyeriana var. granulata]|uniref:Uncharacterized protein n=1 Tax=Oryza meyeriana var. granulata TaxID=110450 RepID=A0A6G1FDB8_9ORYZ|nr:hypothetical protein E2562_028777 [Oryza meyeriana var. granulata]
MVKTDGNRVAFAVSYGGRLLPCCRWGVRSVDYYGESGEREVAGNLVGRINQDQHDTDGMSMR